MKGQANMIGSVSAMAAGVANTTVRDTGPIGLVINTIDSRVGYLHEEISMLLSVLEPILGQELPPEPENACKALPECRMEEVLDGIAGSLGHAINRLVLVRNRIKL